MYKRLTAFLFSLVLLLLNFAAGEDTANLLKNGGFEKGLEGWGRPAAHLVDDKGAARSGSRCVAGEVQKKNQSKTIAQEIVLDASRVYLLSFWMRSPQRARSIVHLLYGKRGQIEVIQLRFTSKKWRRYETMLSPKISGRHLLRFAIPSSYGATGKPGEVFLDDVELSVLPSSGRPENLTENDGFNDWPCMDADGSGTLWSAWISFQDGADRLKACMTRGDQSKVFEVPLKNDGSVLWPVMAAGAEGAWLLWSMEVNHNWDVYVAHLSPEGPSPAIRITEAPSVETKACGAVDSSGRLWIAWEGNGDGNREIYATSLADGKRGPVTRLTNNTASDQNPTLCVTRQGSVSVAWDSFRSSNYDIYWRKGLEGRWGPEQRLTTGPALDRRPFLAALLGESWIAWDSSTFNKYRMSARGTKHVLVGKLVGEKLMVPLGLEKKALLHRYVELPALALDSLGRLWIAVRKARGQRGDWDTWLHCYSGGQWSQPFLASGTLDGVTRRAALAFSKGQLHLVWQADNRPNRPARIGYKGPQHSNIYHAAMDAAKLGPPAAPLELTEPKKSHLPNQLVNYRARFNEDMPSRFSIDYQGQELFLYWGLFHEHTELSQCNARGDGSPDTNFAEARDIARLDFAALTDHGQDMIPYDWHHLRKVVSVNHDPNHFLAYLAEEWAGARKNLRDPKRRAGGYGHRNIIFADEHFPRYFDPVENTPPDELWKMLKGVNQITIPHQLADGASRTDWFYVDEKNQPVAEIFQNRGSYEYEGAPRQARTYTPGYSLQDEWARGVVIGVIASPDHGGGGGKAAVFAPDLNRESILEACRKRRTYGTTAAKILLDVRVNGHLMGEIFKAPRDQKVSVSVRVVGAGEIQKVEIIKDNRFVYTKDPEGKSAEFTFVDMEPRKKRSFYYVRILQDDNEIAWSSPVWVE